MSTLRVTRRLVLTLSILTVTGLPVAAQIAPEVPPGWVVVDDMLLPESVVFGDGVFEATPWPYGLVPYVFDASVTSSQQQTALTSMAEIEAVTQVDFLPRTNQADYVVIRTATFNLSSVGMIGGPQNLHIVSWDTKYIVVHEMFHALGFRHEHQRPDRNSFVTILTNNIQPGQENNFILLPTAVTLGPYDFLSIMHYGPCSYANQCLPASNCACTMPTVTCLPAFSQFQIDSPTNPGIGNRTFMSMLDAQSLQSRYGASLPPNLTSMTPTVAAAGGGGFQIHAYGSRFIEGSFTANGVQRTRIVWNGTPLPTTFVDPGHVWANVTAAMLATPGIASVRVENPSPGGGMSYAALNFTINCGNGTNLALNANTVTTATNPCSTFSFSPAAGTWNVFGVSSAANWNIGIGNVMSNLPGSECDFVAGSGYWPGGASVMTPTSGSLTRFFGSAPAMVEYATSTPITVPVPTISGIDPGHMLKAFALNNTATGSYHIEVSGSPNLRWRLISPGNVSFQWRSAAQPVAAGWVGGAPAHDLLLGPGSWCLVVSRDGGVATSYEPFTLNVCFGASYQTLNTAPQPLTGAGQGFCFPFNIVPDVGKWNVVGVSSASDWDISMGAVASQLDGSQCDYLVANGRQGSITPLIGLCSRYSGGGDGYASHALTYTLPNTPGGTYGYVAMLTIFEFNVPAAAAYDINVNANPNDNYLWDLHLPGQGSGWRHRGGAASGGHPADGTTVPTVALEPGWHAVAIHRNGGPGASVNVGFSVVLSAIQPPILASFAPTSAPAGSPAFTLSVYGSNFDPSTVVRWNGVPLPTTFLSTTALEAAVDPALVASPATATVTVYTPGGGTSAGSPFTIENGVPVLDFVTPALVHAGESEITVTLDGSGFLAGCDARWDGVPLPTVYVSDTQILAVIAATLLERPITVMITVFNPAPGGGESNWQWFNVFAPRIYSTIPDTIPVQAPGAAAINVNIVGNYFLPLSVVYADGVPLATAYVNEQSLDAVLDPALFPQTAIEGGICLNVQNTIPAASNTFALRVGTGTNAGTIGFLPLAPLANDPIAMRVESGQPSQPLSLILDAGSPTPVPQWPDPATNLVLGVTDLAGSTGPWLPLLDGIGIFGPADGTAFDSRGVFVITGLTMPPTPLGITFVIQAAYLDPNAGLGFSLTWARSAPF